MFCRVCGFRGREWESCRTYRTSRFGINCHITHRSSSRYCGTGIQNSQKFRVGYRKAVPLPRVLWHRRTEPTEDPGTGMNVTQNLHKFRVRVRKCYRTHRSSGHCGTGVQNSQKFRVAMKMLYSYPGNGGMGVHNLQRFFVG